MTAFFPPGGQSLHKMMAINRPRIGSMAMCMIELRKGAGAVRLVFWLPLQEWLQEQQANNIVGLCVQSPYYCIDIAAEYCLDGGS